MNIGYLVLSILRWLLYAPVGVCANIVVWLTCWLLPVFSFFTDDGQLPRYLRWAQTHDNSLDSLWAGSEGAKHRANNSYPWLYQYSNEQIAQSYILRYLARAITPSYHQNSELNKDAHDTPTHTDLR